MDHEVTVLGWEDWAGDRWEGEPENLADAVGLFVVEYDPETDTHQHFWAFTTAYLDNWDDWLDLIDEYIDMYAQASA